MRLSENPAERGPGDRQSVTRDPDCPRDSENSVASVSKMSAWATRLLDPSRVIVLRTFEGTAIALALMWILKVIDDKYNIVTVLFARQFFHNDAIALGWMIGAMVVLFPLLGTRWVLSLARSVWALAGLIGARPWCSGVVLTAVAAVGALTVYHAHTFTMDEYAVTFQAQLFAAGKLTANVPIEWFDRIIQPTYHNMFFLLFHDKGQLASAYWPAFSILMAPLAAVGAPWLLNPIISGLTVVLFVRFAQRITGDRECAGWAALLLCASPVFLANGISYYSMSAHLFFNLLFAYLLLSPDRPRLVAAGFVGSIACTLHNPVPHALFALPWLIWLARGQGGVRRILWLGVGYFPLATILGGGWLIMRISLADPDPGVAASLEGASIIGRFQALLGFFQLPSWEVVAIRLASLVKVWAWTVPGLLILAVSGFRDARQGSPLRLVGASLITTFFGYCFVPMDQGYGWGYRYLHSAFFALPLLAAYALRPSNREGNDAVQCACSYEGVALLAAVSLLAFIPLRAWQMDSIIGNHLAQRPHVPADARAVVMIHRSEGRLPIDFVQNDPFLRSPVTTFMSQGSESDERFMARYFPGSIPLAPERYGRVWLLP